MKAFKQIRKDVAIGRDQSRHRIRYWAGPVPPPYSLLGGTSLIIRAYKRKRDNPQQSTHTHTPNNEGFVQVTCEDDAQVNTP